MIGVGRNGQSGKATEWRLNRKWQPWRQDPQWRTRFTIPIDDDILSENGAACPNGLQLNTHETISSRSSHRQTYSRRVEVVRQYHLRWVRYTRASKATSSQQKLRRTTTVERACSTNIAHWWSRSVSRHRAQRSTKQSTCLESRSGTSLCSSRGPHTRAKHYTIPSDYLRKNQLPGSAQLHLHPTV